jgi:hypothetical protein
MANQTICYIVGRNLGDSAVESFFIKRLIAGRSDDEHVVWTRHENSFFFESFPVDVIVSRFPVGTNKHFRIRSLPEFASAVGALRQRRIDLSFDFIGDIREKLLAHLIASRCHLSPKWCADHHIREMIRGASFLGKKELECIPNSLRLYESYAFFVSQVQGVGGGCSIDTRFSVSRVNSV